jgi:hypothetical protein
MTKYNSKRKTKNIFFFCLGIADCAQDPWICCGFIIIIFKGILSFLGQIVACNILYINQIQKLK